MEAFGSIDAGAWSIVPPLLALALALVTKEVYSSLTIGIFVGMVIYTFVGSGPGIHQLIQAFTMVPQMMAEQISANSSLLLFLACSARSWCWSPLPAGRAHTANG